METRGATTKVRARGYHHVKADTVTPRGEWPQYRVERASHRKYVMIANRADDGGR